MPATEASHAAARTEQRRTGARCPSRGNDATGTLFTVVFATARSDDAVVVEASGARPVRETVPRWVRNLEKAGE